MQNLGVRDIFDIAERKANQNLEEGEGPNRLFELKQSAASEMRMRELPPVELTTEALDNMNSKEQCKAMISELWERCRCHKESLVKVVGSSDK